LHELKLGDQKVSFLYANWHSWFNGKLLALVTQDNLQVEGFIV